METDAILLICLSARNHLSKSVKCFWWRILNGGFTYVTCLQSFLKLKPKTTLDATQLKKRRSVFEDWITQTQHWVNRADWARHTRRSNRVKAFLCWLSFENYIIFFLRRQTCGPQKNATKRLDNWNNETGGRFLSSAGSLAVNKADQQFWGWRSKILHFRCFADRFGGVKILSVNSGCILPEWFYHVFTTEGVRDLGTGWYSTTVFYNFVLTDIQKLINSKITYLILLKFIRRTKFGLFIH